ETASLPGRERGFPTEFQAIVQAEGPAAPEFDRQGKNAPTGPVRGTGDFAKGEPRGKFGDALFKREAAFKRARLIRGPRAQARAAVAGGETGVGFGGADRLDGAAHADLPAQAFPMETERGLGVGLKLPSLRTLRVRIEGEAARIDILKQHHAHVGETVRID